MPQSHSWYFDSVEVHNEPTNEELDLQANLAVTYGVRGLLYFAWNSQNNPGQIEYARALTEPSGILRQKNIYQQDKTKKQTMIDLIKRMKKWEPYIMSFDNEHRKSFIYRNSADRVEMRTTTFIKELQAFPAREFAPDPFPDLTNDNPETNSNAYLQAAFFQKENETEQSKYFMIVNRRCSPFINYTSANNIGGRRFVTMKINRDSLPGFNNWKIFNVETGDSVITFNKNDTGNFVFIGEFLPGEGKLFKIAPVMQEGGRLVADEYIEGVSLVCLDTVKNNGKNIEIHDGTDIQFKTGAAIIMSGGNFICSNENPNNNLNINFMVTADSCGMVLH